jgi:hypothetical protein
MRSHSIRINCCQAQLLQHNVPVGGSDASGAPALPLQQLTRPFACTAFTLGTGGTSF